MALQPAGVASPEGAVTVGRWFPGFRTGTPEQTRAYREAVHALHTNGLYEHRAGIRTETPRYLSPRTRRAR